MAKNVATPTMDDAISTLYANIRFASAKRPAHTLAVASASAGDGKTTIALRLAQAMARAGRRVLLVDANFHDPALAAQLGLGASEGLGSLICGQKDLTSVVVPTSQQNLFFLGAERGLLAPADLLGTDAAKAAVDALATAYDYVVFDTPALETYVDAAVLASLVDATVLVARVHATPRDALAAAADQLAKAGANVIGTVLNAADPA